MARVEGGSRRGSHAQRFASTRFLQTFTTELDAGLRAGVFSVGVAEPESNAIGRPAKVNAMLQCAHEKTRLGWRQSETGYPFDYDDDTDPKI